MKIIKIKMERKNEKNIKERKKETILLSKTLLPP